MKKQLISICILAASIIFLPAVPVCFAENSSVKESAALSAHETENASEPSAVLLKTPEISDYIGTPYKVLDVSTGKILEVSELEYVIGAVCAEMPASFETEALKAQAVAAHTYAERQRLRERSSPTKELNGADFSNDTSKYQGYFTKEQAKRFFGENFDENYAKISAAVAEVLPCIITFEDEPIISAFHSMSSGRTESAENAWGGVVEYLVPVDSSSDTEAPKYREEVRYTKEVLSHKLKTAFPQAALGDDFTKWLSVGSVSDSGTVLEAEVGGMKVSGNDVRTALALRSACFEVKYVGEEIVLTTKGYGHGVGMSQYGANAMAAEGKTWREIIGHYYKNCDITELKTTK